MIKISSYTLIESDIKALKERLEAISYSTTASYSLTGGTFGGFGGSKVESFSIRKMELEREIREKQRLLQTIDKARECAELTKRERDLIAHIISGGSLSSFARQRNIYKSHIYKIRDKALGKMVDYIRNDTE